MLRGIIRWITYFPFRWICEAIFIKGIRGEKNLPRKGGYILCPNHSSHLDIIALSAAIKRATGREVAYLSKIEMYQNPITRYILLALDPIPFDRKKEGGQALSEALKALENGRILGIFPEGTRTYDGKIQKGKSGAIRLAHLSGLPIIPVYLDGPYKIMPRESKFPTLKKEITIIFGKPIHLKKKNTFTKKELKEKTANLMKKIEALRP